MPNIEPESQKQRDTGAPWISPALIESTNRSSLDYSDEFASLTRKLSRQLPVRRAVLVFREPEGNRLVAMATWCGGERRTLSLRLPRESSLFAHVAEDGRDYAENFCACFSGNAFERRLLLDEDSNAFILHPVKFDGGVVGLMGFSSDDPSAFATCDDGFFDFLTADLAVKIVKFQRQLYSANR
ncbi:MAG TPA: GAF domain-containing protein [Candidatus Acidoferrum sp.]|nr:GAF domain-containing protein [Candidatus Acidoferrum sp.]